MTELEQKLLFAARLRREPDSALMIAASILGRATIDANPMLAINAADMWPHDPVVMAEIQRLNDAPVDKRIYITEMHSKANKAFERGDHKSYAAIMQLVLNAEGYLKGVSTKDDGKTGEDKLAELAAMVLDG
jgi:hypothetical protein